jgi:spore maturation protein CgeB
MNLPDKYDFRPDIVLSQSVGSGGQSPIQFIEPQLKDFIPDLWLDIDAGFRLVNKPKNGVRAVWYTDPHVLRHHYLQYSKNYDFRFTTQLSYSENGEYFLPYGFDSEWHSPMDVDKIYDVTLIGNKYPIRISLMNRMAARGIKTFFNLGLAKDDARLVYNQSISGLNLSSMNDITARCFELSGLGIVPILNYVPYIGDFFTDKENCIIFQDEFSAIEGILSIVGNPSEAKRLSENARKNVLEKRCSWDDRVQDLLETIELIPKLDRN